MRFTYPEGRDYLTGPELAELLDVARSTVRAWVRRGVAPPGYRVGEQWRFPVATTREWCAARGIPVPPAPGPGNAGQPGA